MESQDLVCPACSGTKKHLAFFGIYPRGQTGPGAMEVDCSTCRGTGQITALQQAWMVQGEALRQRRLQLGYGMRAFAEVCGIMPSIWCDMEHGRLKPEWPANAPTTPDR